MIDFSQQLNKLKGRWWKRQLLTASILATSVFAITTVIATAASVFAPESWLRLGLMSAVTIALITFILSLLHSRLSQGYLALSVENLLLHINRVVPQTEESTHLLLSEQHQLSALQRLQKQRVERAIAQQQSRIEQVLTQVYEIKSKLIRLSLILVIAATALVIKLMIQQQPTVAVSNSPVSIPSGPSEVAELTWQITITPPPYTKLPVRQATGLNIEAPEGAMIEWLATASQPVDLALRFAQQPPLAFTELPENQYSTERRLTASTLYSIANPTLVEGGTPDIHTLSMLRDRAPSIQIEQPIATVSEYTKSERPIVDVRVAVHDDYGLTDVFISASIAKGTGEAVKFRDETFQFDTDIEVKVDETGMYRSLTKQWDFQALDMEPGDELYFSVNAIDNRQPEPQVTQSNTKILKWLDDDEIGISGDGILIDFIPEYFKSQRQIIIETIDLIDRRPLLSIEEFEQTSRDLALAQSDLKQRYGQYLGDEFESGVMQTMESGPTLPSIDEYDHDHDKDKKTLEFAPRPANVSDHSDHEHHDGHDHGHAHEESDQQSLSGYDEVIEQFGHNHGEADVGFIVLKQGQLNPKALMKQSLTNMWQAELFLHLADPKNALPYEQKALDYLNRARKAERVYVKRLGFKPPPVTEERRYDGDLSDILESKLVNQNALDKSLEQHTQQLLARLSSLGAGLESFTTLDAELLQQISTALTSELKVSDDTQQILEVMSILERFSLQQQWRLDDCADCIKHLTDYFWQRLPTPIAEPTLRVGKTMAELSVSIEP